MSSNPEDIKRRLREILGASEQLQAKLKNLTPEQKQKLSEHLKGKAAELESVHERLETAGALFKPRRLPKPQPADIADSPVFKHIRSLPYEQGERLVKFWVCGWLFPVDSPAFPKSLTPSTSARSTPKIATYALKKFGMQAADPDSPPTTQGEWVAQLARQCQTAVAGYGPAAHLSSPESQEAHLVEFVGAVALKFGVAPRPESTALAFAPLFVPARPEVPDWEEHRIARAVLTSIWLQGLAAG